MKRITLFLMAALLVAATGLAQSQQKKVKDFGPQPLRSQKAPSKSSLQRQNNLSRQEAARWIFSSTQKAFNGQAQTRAIGDLLIENQPAGEYVSYVRNSDAYTYFYGVYQVAVTGGAGDVVFGDNGAIYIKNLLTQYPCNSWSKGKIDGSKITFEFPQPAMNYGGTIYYAFLLDGETWEPSDETTLTLNYDAETGAITTPEGSDFATGDLFLGLCTETGGFTGYGDWNINLTKQTDETVAAPEGLETEQYSLTAATYGGSLVNVGIDGDDIYVQGIYTAIPEAWVKGTISGGKAIFKTGQYLGSDGSNHQYLVSATGEEVYDDYYEEYYTEYTLSDTDIEFDYDATTKSLTNSSTFLVNAGKDNVYYAAAFEKAKIAPFKETAATPAAPNGVSFSPYNYAYYADYGWGWGYIQFNIQTQDVDGEFILPEKISYTLWTRTEGVEQPVELTPDLWVELNEPMTEIPYNFTDGWDINVSGNQRSVYYYMTGFDAIGVQTIYRGAGEERKSEIAWVETGIDAQPAAENPTYPELDPANTGASIVYSLYDGNDDFALIGDKTAETYDVAMKVQDPALVGTHIDKITFPLMSTTGVSDIKVWLSSNLRVEDGKNVPNLITVPVEKAEAGFITVELEKPYTIPEEGVYVGYSFTVDDATIEANQLPIVALPAANDGGLYIHTSKVYLKWLDESAEIGASAYIQVEVSGSGVKGDAASVKANDILYVKAGEDITVSTTVVNHGGNGIKSVDVDYTLNGTTTSKHVDLDEAVEGAFGKAATIKAELPAIAERGNYDLNVKVTKVNGVDNEDAAAESTDQITVLNTVPKHRALLEEYTGLWCGWCPRGFLGLEKLAELYPDEYVLVSYHNGDGMEILPSSQFPSPVQGFPDAWIDRVLEVDAYYGYDEDYGKEPLTVVKPLNERAAIFGQADIQLAASLDADESKVTVDATVTFPYDIDNNKYALEYILVADGLSDDSWSQSNYYSGQEPADENFVKFTEAESSVTGLVFNDVAAAVSQIGGIDGSLPEAVKADEAYAHSYSFDLSEAVNTSGDPVVQDVKNVRVVALLIDTETGEVANAQKVKVGETTGIQTILSNDNNSNVTERYNAAGLRLAAPQKGLNIIKLSNGKTLKVIVK